MVKFGLKDHRFSRTTPTITVLSIPIVYDISFRARREPLIADLASAQQEQQSQGTRNPEVQKARNSEIQQPGDIIRATEPVSQ